MKWVLNQVSEREALSSPASRNAISSANCMYSRSTSSAAVSISLMKNSLLRTPSLSTRSNTPFIPES